MLIMISNNFLKVKILENILYFFIIKNKKESKMILRVDFSKRGKDVRDLFNRELKEKKKEEKVLNRIRRAIEKSNPPQKVKIKKIKTRILFFAKKTS